MSDSYHLGRIAKEIRRSIVKMNSASFASHSGSALSVVDILTTLYFKVLNIDPDNPSKKDRDIVILSKGHGSSALYAALAHRGFFELSVLGKFYTDNGILPGHLDKEAAPGVEVSSGSLGHGLSVGLGMAIARKRSKSASRVVVISGDGELNEGSMWEAIMFAPQQKVDNLTLVVDYNKLQGYGETNEVINLEPLKAKFESFNWLVLEVDGHNFDEVERAFLVETQQPKVIVAHTVKGKGVSYMEGQFIWHYKSQTLRSFCKHTGNYRERGVCKNLNRRG